MSNPTDKPVTWTANTDVIQCYLKDGETTKPVFVKYDTSDSGIIELKVVQPVHNEPRENFDNLKVDIGEFFGQFNRPAPYKDYIGLFLYGDMKKSTLESILARVNNSPVKFQHPLLSFSDT